MTGYAKLAVALLLAVLGFGAGWTSNGWRLDAARQRDVAAERTATLAAVRAADDEREAWATRQAAIDETNSRALREAKDETSKLRDCVAAGTCGLRIAATCRRADLPGTPAGGGVDTGASPRLTADAEQAYFALRDGIVTVRAQLAACQETLTDRLKQRPDVK